MVQHTGKTYLEEIEEMSQNEFEELVRYMMEISGGFIQGNSERAGDVNKNIRKFKKNGGNPLIGGNLSAMIGQAEGPKEYVEMVRDRRDQLLESCGEEDFDGQISEPVYSTIEELLRGYFKFDGESRYMLE
ncbi:MAG: hypothetical protein ABEJ56_02825 [Candidatus Nanohaloarchaea archaeon]